MSNIGFPSETVVAVLLNQQGTIPTANALYIAWTHQWFQTNEFKRGKTHTHLSLTKEFGTLLEWGDGDFSEN